MKKPWNLGFAVAALLCCSLLVLAACGGDDDDGDGGEPTTVSQETPDGEPTDEPSDGDEATPTEEEGEAPAEGEIDACSLLSDEEVQAAVGGATDPPESQIVGENFHQCQWRIQGGTDIDNSVVVQARDDTSDDDFERLVDENAPEEAGDLVPIEGLGDKAYQHIATFVLSGDAMVVVTVINSETVEEVEQRQQDLARAAIGRLP